jgi:acyl-CoA thioesterase YciA
VRVVCSGVEVRYTSAMPRARSPSPPRRDAAIRMIAMPADANPSGDIFGGWIMSLMDMAGGQVAYQFGGGRVVTVAVDEIVFLVPVAVGDEVSCYATVARTGRTSIRTHVGVWTRRRAAVQGHGRRLYLCSGRPGWPSDAAAGQAAGAERGKALIHRTSSDTTTNILNKTGTFTRQIIRAARTKPLTGNTRRRHTDGETSVKFLVLFLSEVFGLHRPVAAP